MEQLLSSLQAGLKLHRNTLWVAPLATILGWQLVTLSGPDAPEQQWVWLEVVLIPAGILLSSDPFIRRYERGELELFLSRQPARWLFCIFNLLPVGALLLSALAITPAMATGSPLVVCSRTLLQFGVVQALLMLTRNRWFTLTVFSLWWLVALVYMSDWARDERLLVLLFHPMRLSGGGSPIPALEWGGIAVGASLTVLAWLLVGRDHRWL